MDKMIGNAAAGGYYDENVNIWENDIQGLCSMIQDYITQYTYYEMINMEQLQKELKVQMADQVQSYLALLLVVLVVVCFWQLRSRSPSRNRCSSYRGRQNSSAAGT